jgi:hypothetical protein
MARFVSKIRLTAGSDQPAQLNRPFDPQLLLVDVDAVVVEPKDAAFVTCFWVSRLWQVGQAGSWSASENRTIFSNTSPQTVQR